MRMLAKCPSVPMFIIIIITCWLNHISGDTTEERKLAAANNEFALNLHKELASGSLENVFFSPLSLSTVFGMLYYGLKGESAKQLRNVLGYEASGLSNAEIHSTFHHLLSQISNSTQSPPYILKSANTILIDKSLQLNLPYKTNVQDMYLSPVKEVNFAVDGQRIVEEVNKWVEDNTSGKIRQILKDVDPMTAMVLLNAFYFKGRWKTPFDPKSTKPAVFYNGSAAFGSKRVDMMNLPSALLPYTESADYQALEMPYVGEHLSMLILLPKQPDGLASLEQNLTTETLTAIRQKMTPKKVQVHLPRFKMTFNMNLAPDLQQLGMTKIFQSGSEDFSGISTKDSKKLSVTDVVHKCELEVNEEGSEAAAGSSGHILFVRLDRKAVFRADHPFLFFVLDKRGDLILFMGRLTNM